MDIDIRGLAPEEQELILQFGKISRPFSEQHKADKAPIIARAFAALQNLAAAARTWEVTGVDISYWQGEVDFDILCSVANFVFIRYGYGNEYFDPRAEGYARGCADHNTPYDGYWYGKPGNSFTKHATNFKATRANLGGKMYPIFDEEETGGLNKTDLNGWLYKWHMTFGDLTSIPLEEQMIYMSPGFAGNVEANDWMKKTKLDVAHWTTAELPIIPSFWTKVLVPLTKFTFWQHAVTSSEGFGVQSSKIDRQRYWGTRPNFETEFNVTLPAPEPPPIIIPPRVRINYAGGVYERFIPTTEGNSPLGIAYNNTVWNTVGEYAIDSSGKLWYLISKEPANRVWIAAWLTLPA